MDKKKTAIITIILCSAIVIGILIGYSYYIMSLDENNIIDTNITSDKLTLTYTDCTNDNLEECANIDQDLSPGDTATKTFQIENTSKEDLAFALYFKDLINTFKNDDLIFSLENTSDNTTIIENQPVPSSEQLAEKLLIKNNISIPAGEIKKYKLKVTFQDRDTIQNENLDAKYSFKITITEKVE